MMKPKPERALVEHGRVGKLRLAMVWLKCLAPPASEARFDRITKKILNGVAPGTARNYLSTARRGVRDPSWQEIKAASDWAFHERLPNRILERYRTKMVEEMMAPMRCVLEHPELSMVVIKIMLIQRKLGRKTFAEVAPIIVPDMVLASIRRS